MKTQPIRILHIASGDLWAGAEVQLYYLAKALHAAEGVTLKVLLLNPGELQQRLAANGIDVDVIDERQHGLFSLFSNAKEIAQTFKPNVIHTHRYKENILGSLIAKQFPGTRSVRTVHGAQEIDSPWWRIDQRLIQAMDHYCGNKLQDKIIAVSADLAEKLKSTYRPEKITVIENGIDVGEVHKAANTPVTLPGPDNNIKIAIICRLVPVKRVDIFLNIIQLLEQQQPGKYSGYIFGDGPLEADLKQQSLSHNINHCTHFMGFKTNILAYLNQMNCLLITSDHEGLPMNALEALSLGKYIITHAVGGLPTVLHQGKYGALVNTQDPAHYVDAIIEKTSRINNDAYDDEAIAPYTSENNRIQYITVYQRLTRSIQPSK